MQFDVFSFPWLCTSGSVGSRWNFHQPWSLGNCDEQTSLPTHGRQVAYVQNMLCWVKQKQQQQTKIQTDWLVSWCLSLSASHHAFEGSHLPLWEGTPKLMKRRRGEGLTYLADSRRGIENCRQMQDGAERKIICREASR